VVAVIVVVIAIIGLWSGIAMGRLTSGPRVVALTLCTIGAILELISLLRVAGANTGTAYPILITLVTLVLNVLIIYLIGFAGSTRAAFRAAKAARQQPAYAAVGTPYQPQQWQQQQGYQPASAQYPGQPSGYPPAAPPQPPAPGGGYGPPPPPPS